MVRKGHQCPSMNQSVLLSKGVSPVNSRLTPTPTTRGQFNPKRMDKFRVLKNLLHQAEICFIHLVSALTSSPARDQDSYMSIAVNTGVTEHRHAQIQSVSMLHEANNAVLTDSSKN